MGGRSPSERTRVVREPDRDAYDRVQIDSILDAGLVCHLGFVYDDHPFVNSTLYVRVAEEVYVRRLVGKPDAAGAQGRGGGERRR